MTDRQYAVLVLELSALGQLSAAFDGLDAEQLFNLVFLLEEARKAAEQALQRTKEQINDR